MNATLFVTALALAAPAAKDKPAPDTIVGTWQLEQYIVEGKPVQAKDPHARWTFDADGSCLIVVNGKLSVTRPYIVDATKSPAHLDLDPAGAKRLGIYKIDGDTLTMVIGDPGTPRPEKFDSKEDSRYVLKRVKAK